ncbi:hypothetical protein DRE_02666 [Drechslerella stenobrocha 248]|uniref:MARVEL domain-containing protein n=1 Tax=Drechslerella stenobrocha 248 TaxID=1043628 RepID=W7I7K5_9PEZI|nr:hypothetical protein DRE_02666 [Drechslerella stenobrocha 248]
MSKVSIYLPRVLAIVFRLLQLLSAVIVTGIAGHYCRTAGMYKITPEPRFVYTTVIASTSLVYAFFCLLFWRYTIIPADALLFVLNLAAFGCVVNWIGRMGCEKAWDVELHTQTWLSGKAKDQCGRWAAVETFTFVAAILFLASACMAGWKLWKQSKSETGKPEPWYRCL